MCILIFDSTFVRQTSWVLNTTSNLAIFIKNITLCTAYLQKTCKHDNWQASIVCIEFDENYA